MGQDADKMRIPVGNPLDALESDNEDPEEGGAVLSCATRVLTGTMHTTPSFVICRLLTTICIDVCTGARLSSSAGMLPRARARAKVWYPITKSGMSRCWSLSVWSV